jgi:hypothetical protein
MTSEDTARIPLYARDGGIRGYTIVDADDAEWVSQWRWGLNGGYAVRSRKIGGRQGTKLQIRLHRELLGLTLGDINEGDHINRDRLDNRRINLRIVPKGSQCHNTTPMSKTSAYRGVRWSTRDGKWEARVQAQGRNIYLGLFASEEEAAETARLTRLRLLPYAVD